jgi:hypothetical protein
LEWTVGYPLIVMLIVGICAAMYSAFKRNGWLYAHPRPEGGAEHSLFATPIMPLGASVTQLLEIIASNSVGLPANGEKSLLVEPGVSARGSVTRRLW